MCTFLRARAALGLLTALVSLLGLGVSSAAAATPNKGKHPVSPGQKLFERVWQVDDSEAGRDGLGPLFNERSCVACHFLGGIGGAGPNQNNVALLTFAERHVENVPRTQAELVRLHPGFQAGITVVLHRYSSRGPTYAAFCSKLLGLQSTWNSYGDPVRRALEAGEVDSDGPIQSLEIDGKQFELSAQHHSHVRRGLDRQHSRGSDRTHGRS